MKKGIEDFKEALIEGDTFGFELENITSLEDVYNIAKKNGYEFTMEELESNEISDDILDCVAGGVKSGNQTIKTNKVIIPEDTHDTDIYFHSGKEGL